jgi:hypothetical protein
VLFRAKLELDIWIANKIISRIANGDEAGAQHFFFIEIGIRYKMILCFTLENIATLNTAMVLMGIDFVYNVCISLKIVWLNKHRPDQRDKEMELLQELGTTELIEFTAPLVFILSTVVGYYGPNSKYLLNVGATIWQSTPIGNMSKTMNLILAFFVVDFSSTIITAMILWKYCRINLFKAFVALMKEHGPILCMYITFHAYTVSTLLYIP